MAASRQVNPNKVSQRLRETVRATPIPRACTSSASRAVIFTATLRMESMVSLSAFLRITSMAATKPCSRRSLAVPANCASFCSERLRRRVTVGN